MCAIETLASICMGFVSDERGVTQIEYALIVALTTIAALVGFSVLGSSVSEMHEYVSASVIKATGT